MLISCQVNCKEAALTFAVITGKTLVHIGGEQPTLPTLSAS
jgi:hypothetical protein